MSDRSYIAVSENTTAKNALCLDGCAANTYAPIITPSFNTCIITPVIKITSGATAGCVLTSGADGTATWETPAAGGVVMSGSTVNGLTTYVDGDTICSQPNLIFDGSILCVTGNINMVTGAARTIGFNATSSGAGSALCIIGNQGAQVASVGGDVTVRGGQGGNTSGNGGTVYIEGGSSPGSCGGNVIVCGSQGEVLDGCVALYHGNTCRLETTTSGVSVNGLTYTDCLSVNQTNYELVANVAAQFESTNSCEAVRIYGWSGSTGNNTALRVYNKGGTSNGGNCAIYADAYYSAGSSSGCSHGIWALAGGKTSYYNYGIIGQLCGTNDGAGIVGALAGWSTTLAAGCWAGYFEGCTYHGGDIKVATGAARTIGFNANSSGTGSILTIAGNSTNLSTGTGGDLCVCGGAGGNTSTAVGGNTHIKAGCGYTTGGDTYICGGTAVGTGGKVYICSGNATGQAGCVMIYHGTTARLCTTSTGVNANGDITIFGGTTTPLCVFSSDNLNPLISFYCTTGPTRIGYLRGCGSSASMSLCKESGGALDLTTASSCLRSSGSLFLCAGTSGGVYVLVNSTEYGLIAYANSCVTLRYDNVEKFKTVTNGVCVVGVNCGFACDWVATSDCRLKTCVTPISNALSIVNSLCGICYVGCDDERNEVNLGLLAQDVEPILPEVVSHSKPEESDVKYGITDDKLGIKYSKLTAVLIEAVKELSEQNNDLQRQINELKNK